MPEINGGGLPVNRASLIEAAIKQGPSTLILIVILWWFADRAFPEFMEQQRKQSEAIVQVLQESRDLVKENNLILREMKGRR